MSISISSVNSALVFKRFLYTVPSQAEPGLPRGRVLSCFSYFLHGKFITVANRGTSKSYDSRMNLSKFF